MVAMGDDKITALVLANDRSAPSSRTVGKKSAETRPRSEGDCVSS